MVNRQSAMTLDCFITTYVSLVRNKYKLCAPLFANSTYFGNILSPTVRLCHAPVLLYKLGIIGVCRNKLTYIISFPPYDYAFSKVIRTSNWLWIPPLPTSPLTQTTVAKPYTTSLLFNAAHLASPHELLWWTLTLFSPEDGFGGREKGSIHVLVRMALSNLGIIAQQSRLFLAALPPRPCAPRDSAQSARQLITLPTKREATILHFLNETYTDEHSVSGLWRY